MSFTPQNTARLLNAVTAAKGATTPVTGDKQSVEAQDFIMLYALITGANSGSAGNVTLHVYASPDGKNWAPYDITSVVLALAGVAEVKKAVQLNVRGIRYIKVKKVANADASYAATVSAWFGIDNRKYVG